MTFTNNLSDFAATFSSTRVSIPTYWPERIISQPSDTLRAKGHEVLSIECSLKDIAVGPFDATWGSQNGDVWFAVMIHVPLQETRVGNAQLTEMGGAIASYKVSWSSPENQSVDWTRPVENPDESWLFPVDLGWKVRVESQAGGP
ncbi:MAG: hypothetical protein ALECFALPRED_001436, partial [Alectoria fallacina]